MPTTLSSLPKDLPVLKDGTSLTLPIEISVGSPVEDVKFYQSKVFIENIPYITFYSVWALIGLYSRQGLANSLAIFSSVFAILTLFNTYKRFKNNKDMNDSHRFVDDKFAWQAINVFRLTKYNIEVSGYFGNKSQNINYKNVDEFFVLNAESIGIIYGASYLNKIDAKNINTIKDRQLSQKPTRFVKINHRYILANNTYRISLKNLVKLMNEIKNKTHDPDIDTITYQSL